MKALITGGAGFIGYHLAHELLKHGYQVVLADNFSRGVKDKYLEMLISKPEIEICSVDLMSRKNLEIFDKDFDYIYHLAAIIGVQNVLKHSYDVLKNNVEMLINLIDFSRKQNHLKRFVFASTSEVYAGTLQYFNIDFPTPERTPLTITPLEHPRTSYMLSKIYGEGLLRQCDIPFTIVRPHNFYGPRMGMSHVIPELLKKVYFAENEDSLEVFSVEHKRTFCYIDDAVKMIRLLAENKNAMNEVYNVGNETPEVSIGHLAELILHTQNKSLTIMPKPATEGSPIRRCPSMKKTFECIQYSSAVSLEEGIRRTFDWYKEQVFSAGVICAK